MWHVVVTCVKNKALVGPKVSDAAKEIQPRAVRNDVRALFKEWTQFVDVRFAHGPRVAASQLYRGNLWFRYCEAFRRLPEPKCLWIISAGLGLLQGDDLVCGYGATYLADVEDSVYVADYFTALGQTEVHRKWWNQLALWKPSRWAHPRSLQALQESLGDRDKMIVAAGAKYLGALHDDLCRLTPDKRLLLALSKSASRAIPPSLQAYARVYPSANPREAPAEALKQALEELLRRGSP